ncbi:GNAT family N-acetyltransferase [Solibacillus sp. FSL W8-0474]|uniref:GNAT family N-acetyltransferase n=1 Tax=Solibacillus merdavium TaxID=2762218 RepID=A0ABR8XPU5_9BACL|nr:GNAT family N-acetyltransferase [Solibacillus merdavium]MBD8033966.1 GNAT family N-acetyltransferase [Solibacillus merdavium]
MSLLFRKSKIEDIEILLPIQKASFQEDLEKYEDFETNPACETSEKLAENIKKYQHFTILDEDTVIGAIDVRGSDERMHIDKVFVSPTSQDKGVGTAAIQFLEEQFPNVKLWTLYTPHLSFRNHYFYEKFGYKKTKEVQLTTNLILFKYEKLSKTLRPLD